MKKVFAIAVLALTLTGCTATAAEPEETVDPNSTLAADFEAKIFGIYGYEKWTDSCVDEDAPDWACGVTGIEETAPGVLTITIQEDSTEYPDKFDNAATSAWTITGMCDGIERVQVEDLNGRIADQLVRSDAFVCKN